MSESNNVKPVLKNGSEEFTFNGLATGYTFNNFLLWTYCDLLSNITRGKMAEFIVASALGILDNICSTWDKYDLEFMGKGIEIKSAAYLQSWHQAKESDISFGIKATHGWNEESGKYEDEKKRQADVYVFCLLNHKEKATVNPLNLEQWDFYIMPTDILNILRPSQKFLPLSEINKAKYPSCKYDKIKKIVEYALDYKNYSYFNLPKNYNGHVVIYRAGRNEPIQTALHTETTNKTILNKQYSAERLVQIDAMTYQNYKDFTSGKYNPAKIQNLDRDFIIREVGKHFE